MPKDSDLGLNTLSPTISHSRSVLIYYHRLRITALTAKYRLWEILHDKWLNSIVNRLKSKKQSGDKRVTDQIQHV